VVKNFGELVILKFWRGKLWRMLDTYIIGRRKTLANMRVNYLSPYFDKAKADIMAFGS